MAEAIVVNVAAKAVEGLISQTWMEIKCLLAYKRNIKKLKEKVKDLRDRRDTIKLLIDAAERNGEVIGPDVLGWMEKVGNMEKEANDVLARTTSAQFRCLCCRFPKLHSRYGISKEASDQTIEVIELQDVSKFERIGYPAAPGKMPFASPEDFDGFESRIRIRDGILEALRDNLITKIGLCGMGGVGKTTLVREIADKVKAVKLFDEVSMAVVSKDINIAKIQDQIAENLGLKIEEKTIHQRVERLYGRLMNLNNRILVILDDIWEDLDFRLIGIPVEGEREGLKVLLTSRNMGVCTSMRALTFEVKVLSNVESWNLFKEVAEISDADTILNGIAKEVAKECGGLPLSIVIVGKALKNKNDYVWREALQQLKEAFVTSIPGMHDKVYSRLKLSYDYLENGDAKLLLLLCSLFAEDFNIPLEQLVRHAKGWQLFRNVDSMARARDKVYSIVDELKSCYLLLIGDDENSVKLHDAVRDFCLSIASSGEHRYMVQHGGLQEWPQVDDSASYTAISLTFDEGNQSLSCLECPQLKLLLLTLQDHELHMSEGFLEHMNKLQVLGFIHMKIKLPSSIQHVVNLRTLSLDNSSIAGDTSALRSLKKLEILSFYCCSLEQFPHEIGELVNLKSLDLRFQEGPPIPSGIIKNLLRLEDLYLGCYFYGEENKEQDVCCGFISEISSLLNLRSIQFCVEDDYHLERLLGSLDVERLLRFGITKLSGEKEVGEFQFIKSLTLQSINNHLLSSTAVKSLLWKTEVLSLADTNEGPYDLVTELDEKGLVNLKKLKIDNCDLKFLADFSDFKRNGAFINLEHLEILSANNLEVLWHGDLPPGSFARLEEARLASMPAMKQLWGVMQHPWYGSLRSLDIHGLDSVRSIFLKSTLKYLNKLKRISIMYCSMLESIVSGDEDDEKYTGDIVFSKLEYLSLGSLDSLGSFGPEAGLKTLFKKVMLSSIESLYLEGIPGVQHIFDDQMTVGALSKLQSIVVKSAYSLSYIAKSDSIKLLHSLERLEVSWCSVEVIFDFTGLNTDEAGTDSLLSQLGSLRLRCLENLKHIWLMLPEGVGAFKNLTSLHVEVCEMKYLFSPSMVKVLSSLETLLIKRCPLMETLIGGDENVAIEGDIIKEEDGKGTTSSFQFPRLRSLQFRMAPEFQMLCSQNIDMEFPLLTELMIHNCRRMTKFCVGQIHVPRLKNVDVKCYREGGNTSVDVFRSWMKDCEDNIRCINCSVLKNESCDDLDWPEIECLSTKQRPAPRC